MRFLALPIVLLISGGAVAAQQRGSVHDRLPPELDAHSRYVIYLYGRIIEDKGPRPTHETWGTYEYQQILDTLAADGMVLVSEQRPPNTDSDRFAASHTPSGVRRGCEYSRSTRRLAAVRDCSRRPLILKCFDGSESARG